MAVNPPTRGQRDWDDEMNNVLQSLDSGVQSAAAQAAVAASDAAYARNRADEVHTAVLGGADAATAGFINDDTSATKSALSATYGRKSRLDVRDYGTVDVTGATDSSTAVLAAIADAQAKGATLVFPRGLIRVDSQIVLTNDGNTGFPKQKSIRLTGAGVPWDGQWQNPLSGSGTTLDLRYQGGGSGNPKIDTRGAGVLEIDHMGLVDFGAANSAPFLRTTQTTLMIHDTLWMGNTSKSKRTCDQDALILGGTTANYDNTATSGFAGYGSVIERNIFHRIRRAFFGRVWCNSIVFRQNTITIECGSSDAHGAPVVIDSNVSSGSSGFCRGNVIDANTIEVWGYKHAVAIFGANSGANQIVNNGAWDEDQTWWASDYYVDQASGNLFIPGLSTGTVLTEGAGNQGANQVIMGARGGQGTMRGGWRYKNPDSATTVPLQLQRATTQTVNVFESLDASGNVQWKITSGGSLRCEANMGADYPIKINNASFAVPAAYFANANVGGAKIGDPDVLAAIGLTDGSGTSLCGIYTGNFDPEGGRVAPVGSIFIRYGGSGQGPGKTIYVKESGTGNTGWVSTGGLRRATVTTTANYTATLGDHVVIANGASITITLPDPTTVPTGRMWTVKNINSSAVTVNSAGTSKTLDGVASQSLAQWGKESYISNGTQWLSV